MKIAFISTMSGIVWGGSEELWAATADEALSQGHDVAAFTYHWPHPAPKLARLAARGMTLRHRSRRKFYRLDSVVNRVRFPYRMLRSWRPDVICVSQGGTYDVAKCGEFTTLRRHLRRGVVPYAVLCQCESRPPRNDRKRTSAVEFFAGASFVGFLGGPLIAQARTALSAPLDNAEVIRNPVNLNDHSIMPWPHSRTPAFAFVGRLDDVKGLDLLIDVLSRESWRNRDYIVDVYGQGPMRPEFEAAIAQHGLSERLRLHGQVTDIAAIWRDHHLLLLPSRREGVPLAMVEAMICGRPVLVCDVGANREWVADGLTGFMMPEASTMCLEAALEQVWMSQTHWPRMGQAAHDAAMARIDPTPGRTLLRRLSDAAHQKRHQTESVTGRFS